MRSTWIAATLLVSSLWAQDVQVRTVQSLNMEIERVRKAIAEEEKSWAEEKAREAEAEQQRQQRFKEFEREKQEVNVSVSALDQRILSAAQRIQYFKNAKLSQEQHLKVLGGKILEHTLSLSEALKASIPFQLDKRLEAVNLLALDLRQNTATPEEAFGRLLASFQKEIRMSQDAELFTGDISLQSGEKMAVKYIRAGKHIYAYSSGTGAQVGIMRKTMDRGWVWVKEDQMDFETRNAVRNAVAIAEGKAVPGFAVLPFWIQDFRRPGAAAPTPADSTAVQTPAKKEVRS
jgi:hypothetical protein